MAKKDEQTNDATAELEAKTVDELKAEAKDAGVEGYGSMNKADLVAALSADDQPNATPGNTDVDTDQVTAEDTPRVTPGTTDPSGGVGPGITTASLGGQVASGVAAGPSPRASTSPKVKLVTRGDDGEFTDLGELGDALSEVEGNSNFVSVTKDVYQEAPATRSKRTTKRLVYRAGQILPLAQARAFKAQMDARAGS